MSLLHRSFRRVGVVNRGEAAVRFLRTARTWSTKQGVSLEVVALFTTPDRESLFVREADDAVWIGEALVNGRSSYLDIPSILRHLQDAGCDAVWPGWGFLSENPDFADACTAAGLVFIGPSGAAMRALGDKVAAKKIAEQHGVPVVDWSGGPVADALDAQAHADRIGYPVLLKAVAGGGGRGIRVVGDALQMPGAFESAANEARAAFGNADLIVEGLLFDARHIEVQIVADSHGNVSAVGTRDCSMQRRHQKVLEEAPAPGLSEELERTLLTSAVSMARATGYVGAGTAEFLVGVDGKCAFLEMNTRLQVEHTVTECVTGIDLVAAQLDVAWGKPWRRENVPVQGHAIEARLCAEDPDDGFTPSAGRLMRFELPHGPGVRVDTGFAEGAVIPGEFDSMLAKVIATGNTRHEALARLSDALSRMTVSIEGGASNKSLLLELVRHFRFREAPVTTRWLDGYLAERPPAHEKPRLDVALAAAAVSEYVRARRGDVLNFLKDAQRGLPSNVQPAQARDVRFGVGDREVSLSVAAVGPRSYAMTSEGRTVNVRFDYTGRTTGVLGFRGSRLPVVFAFTPTAVHVEVDGVAHRLMRASDGKVVAPVPAAVTFVHVGAGSVVQVGERLITLEVMKMEVGVDAPVAGRVTHVCVDATSRVSAGDPLVLIEAQATGARKSASPLSVFEVEDDAPEEPPAPPADVLLTAVLGYEHSNSVVEQAISQLAGMTRPPPVPQLLRILEARVAREALFVRRSTADEAAPVDHLASYLRLPRSKGSGLPATFVSGLRQALSFYDIVDLTVDASLESALLRLAQAHRNIEERDGVIRSVLTALERHPDGLEGVDVARTRQLLETFAALTHERNPRLAESGWTALYFLRDRPLHQEESRRLTEQAMEAPLGDLAAVQELDELPMGALLALVEPSLSAPPARQNMLLDLLVDRLYPNRTPLEKTRAGCLYAVDERHIAGLLSDFDSLAADLADSCEVLFGPRSGSVPHEVEVFIAPPSDDDALELEQAIARANPPASVQRVSVLWGGVEHGRLGRTFVRTARGFTEDPFFQDFHPSRVETAEVERFSEFELERLPGFGEIFLALVRAKEDPTDERFICLAEIERFDAERDPVSGAAVRLPSFERVFHEALHALREAQLRRGRPGRLHWNRLVLFLRPTLTLSRSELESTAARLTAPAGRMGLERVVLRANMPGDDGALRPVSIEWTNPTGSGVTMSVFDAKSRPVRAISAYERRVVAARRRGLFYPYELVRALTGGASDGPFPKGRFQELDLVESGEELAPVSRPFGGNMANVVVGIVENDYPPFENGLERVLILGDPTRGLGSLAEPECRRILAAFRLARRKQLPVEWVPVSSGAKIAMDSGTENLDWTAKVLAEIVAFTQAGGVVNIIVDGVCVGAQSYWNAEATMLMHCKGALVMTSQGSMLLTGKRALEFAGSVAAEDNLGIGGFERIMGPNGEAQYFAPDLVSAYQLLFRHYALTHVPPGRTQANTLSTTDPVERDPTDAPYTGPAEDGFERLAELFDEATNPGRKRPFAIRAVMRAVVDADIEPLERWQAWQGAQSAVVWEASLGGTPTCVIGIESRPVPRRGDLPADGPDQWTAGTLFPLASKKVARALNVASGARPVVVLANLSGFDGSPDSLRNLQLEYGAEIGRAVVNFKGPLIFCVVSRYHGGAYVVFSKALNASLEAVALEGSYASVIGGAPAAAVVFTGLVRQRALADPKVLAAKETLGKGRRAQRAAKAARYDQALKTASLQAQAAVAKEFDAVHTVERALRVGSLDALLSPGQLRRYLCERVRRR